MSLDDRTLKNCDYCKPANAKKPENERSNEEADTEIVERHVGIAAFSIFCFFLLLELRYSPKALLEAVRLFVLRSRARSYSKTSALTSNRF